MANPDHVEIVKQGAKAIKAWRESNPDRRLDLSEGDLCRAELDIADLIGADLRGADLSRANLRGADLSKAILNRADLSRADLSRADLNLAYLNKANLSRANLRGAYLSGADLNEANLIKANLSRANLNHTCLNRADLNEANLHEANLNEAILNGADLRGANLSEANLSGAYLNGAYLSTVRSARTLWADLDLTQTVGLESVRHWGPSSLSVDTLMKSNGKIPEIFLRGCGLSDDFILYVPSHFANSAIDFYSCFISYSHEDKSFARRLHDALQGRGIRCWLDEHQLLPGDNIYDRIDQGIRVWDKVLLCASKNSLTSGWVDDELKHAFAKEKKLFKERGREVLSLIPLNLDGHLFSAWQHPKRNQILERLAADFTDWETDNSKFEEQFERIVKALRTKDAGREPDPIPKL